MSNYNQLNLNEDDSGKVGKDVSHEVFDDREEMILEDETITDNLSLVEKADDESIVKDESQLSEIMDSSDKFDLEQKIFRIESHQLDCISTLSKLDVLIETQQQLVERLDLLSGKFDTKIMHSNHEEKIVDQMHRELQKYKDDLYAQLVRPILVDVIEVRDSILRMSAVYLAKPEGETSIPNKSFSDYAYDLQEILEKNRVELYKSKNGDDFVPIKQRVVKKVVTHDETLHGKVAETLSNGYSYDGKTISPEKITVYSYEEEVQEKENSEVIENG